MTRYILALAILVLGSAVAAQTPSGTQKISGYLVDAVCAGNHATEPGYKEAHDKACNFMAACVRSGYSLILADNTVLTFDAKGNELAQALFRATDTKDKNHKATATGKVEGKTVAVTNITLD